MQKHSAALSPNTELQCRCERWREEQDQSQSGAEAGTDERESTAVMKERIQVNNGGPSLDKLPHSTQGSKGSPDPQTILTELQREEDFLN